MTNKQEQKVSDDESVDISNTCCAVCGVEGLHHMFWARDTNWNTTDETFSIAQCRQCGITQTIPQPSPEIIHAYYPDIYYPTGEPSKKYYKHHIQRYERDKIAKIHRHRSGGRLLDIGCGVGFFVREANSAGFKAQGIEFSEQAALVGKERWGLDVTCGDFLSHPYPESFFDIVTLWHVFEHLYRPKDILHKVNNILASGGLLVISVPNISSIQAGVFRERWYHLGVPRHLFHYSPQSLTGLVAQCGFVVKDVDHFSYQHNGGGILASVIQLAPPAESFVHKLFRKTLGSYVAHSLALIESSVKRGGTFTLIAVKP